MGNENPTGICKPQILRNTSYIVTSEEVFVEGVVMIIFPKEMKFLYDHHRKGDEPWRKIPTGICKARRHYIDSIADIHIQGCWEAPQGRVPDKLGRPLLTSAFAKRREVPLTYSENSVPCHHPQQKGLCFIDPHHAAEGNQKSTLLDRKRVEYARQRTCSQAHLPIARRSNGCTKQAVLLTLLPRSSSLPDLLKSVTSLDSLCITVAGPCRSFTGLPY